MEPRRSLTLRWLPVAILATALIAGGLFSGRVLAQSRDNSRERDAAAWLGEAAQTLNRGLTRANRALAAPGSSVVLTERLVAGAGSLDTIATLDRDADITGVSPPRAGGDLETLLESTEGRVTLERARDSGHAELTEPISHSNGEYELITVVPRYAAGVSAGTVAARREAIDGYLVGRLNVDAILLPITQEMGSIVDGVAVRTDGVTLADAGSLGPGPVVDLPVDVSGQPWELRAIAPESGVAAPYGLAFFGIVLAAGVVGATARAQRAADRIEDVAEERERDLRLIGEAGSLLQRSLDLTDVLPAIAILLSDNLELAGISILCADDNGTLGEVFSAGRRPTELPASVADLRHVPTELGQGDEAVVPLERAGRAVGAVWIQSRRAMGPSEVQALVAVAELTGSAIVNAQTFEREQETARQLLELDHLKTEFLGTVSHELRTPIAAIMGFSSILLDRDAQLDDDRRRDLLARVVRNAQSLGTLVSGLLDFARAERRSLELAPEVQDLAALVQQVVAQTETLFEEHDVEVVAPEAVYAAVDTEGIERILSNLLTNAAKFSPAGSPIRVAVRREGDRAVLEVTDRGPGIPVEERTRIFSRFYRGTHELARSTRGAGVGLAVVKELTERLSGTVAVDDAPETGSRFTISFPIAADEDRGGRHDAA